MIELIKKYAVATMAFLAFTASISGGYAWYSSQEALAQQVKANTAKLTKVEAQMELDKINPRYWDAKRTAAANPNDEEAQEEFDDLRTRRTYLKTLVFGK